MASDASGGVANEDTARSVPRPDGLLCFLGGIAIVAVGYTAMAMDMEWRTEAGRIGPGFFPRIVGLLVIVLCCCAAAVRIRVLRRTAAGEPSSRPATTDDDEAGHHTGLLLAVIAATVGFVVMLEQLGAVLTSTLLLLGLLFLLNRPRPRTNVAVSILIPVGLYVLFDVLLNAGLPQGPFPLP